MAGYDHTLNRVTAEQALAVRCPKCSAPHDMPCTYMPPPPIPADASPYQSYQLQLDRAGTPTKIPHVERRDMVRRDRWAKERARHRRKPPTRPEAELLAAERAGRVFDRQEYVALAVWLRTWGKQLFNEM